MANEVGKLVAVVTADVSKAQQQIAQGLTEAGEKGSQSFGQKFAGGVRKAAVPATVALGGLAAAGFGMVKGAEDAATANARLATVLKDMGYEENTKAAQDLAESMEQQVAIDADVIKQSQALLGTFSDVAASTELMGRTTRLAADLQAAGYGDMNTAAIGLGKALQDPITGMSLLTRQGSLTKDEQKAIAAEFERTGDKAKAQESILAALEKQVGGVAEATANTSDKMSLGFKAVGDSIGNALLPMFEALAPKIKAFSDWAANNGPLLVKIGGAIAGIAAAIITLNIAMKVVAAVRALSTAFQVLFAIFRVFALTNPVGLIITGVVALIAGLVLLWKNSETFRNIVIGVWEAVKAAVLAVVAWFTDSVWPALQAVWDGISEGARAVWEGVQAGWAAIQTAVGAVADWFTGTLWPALQAVWDGISTGVEFMVGLVKGYIDLWVAAFKLGWKVISTVTTTVWNAVKAVITTVINVIKGYIEVQVRAIVAIWDGIKNIVGKVVDAFKAARDKVVEWINTIKTRVGEKVAEVVGKFYDTLVGIVGKVAEAFTAARAKVVEWIGLIKTKVEEKVGLVVDAFKTAITKVIGVGRDIVDGLWRGISGAWDWVMGKVRGLVDKLPAIVKKALGISSPSKVFAGIGDNIMLGLVDGIIDGSKAATGALLDTVDDLTSVMPDTVPLTVTPAASALAPFAPRAVRAAAPPSGRDVAAPLVQVFIGNDELDAYLVRVQRREQERAAGRLIAGRVG